jgi:two-component system chemotaxis response regulator CheY
MKSIVADDVLVIRRLLQRALSTYGQCDAAVNGTETVTKFFQSHEEKDPYNLICLDILMPQKSGLQVIKDIREFEEKNNITTKQRVKIIMTTILQDQRVVEQAQEYGCDGYMVKPIDLRKLLSLIRKFGLIE